MAFTAVAANDGALKSVNLEKARAYHPTKFVEHLLWPSKEVIASKQVSKKLIPADMQRFKNMLTTVLKPPYAVRAEEIDSNAVAVESLRDPNDYILLEFRRNGKTIRIQDSKGLAVAFFPDNEAKVDEPNLAQYVRKTAFELLNVPKVDDKGQEPRVFISKLDIGASKWGTITYIPGLPPKFWNSSMAWWSDGRNVLFVIGTASFDGIDLTKMAAMPPNWLDPRRFKKTPQP